MVEYGQGCSKNNKTVIRLYVHSESISKPGFMPKHKKAKRFIPPPQEDGTHPYITKHFPNS